LMMVLVYNKNQTFFKDFLAACFYIIFYCIFAKRG
jgi:hypothetical protein